MKYTQKTPKNPKAIYMSIKEIGNLFDPKIPVGTLINWQKNGTTRFKPYQLGRKKYYKRHEVLQEIEQLKQS